VQLCGVWVLSSLEIEGRAGSRVGGGVFMAWWDLLLVVALRTALVG